MITVTTLSNLPTGHSLESCVFESLDSFVDGCVLNPGGVVEIPDLSECDDPDLRQRFLDTIQNKDGILYEWSVDDIGRSYYFIESSGRDFDYMILFCVKSLLLQRNSPNWSMIC